MEQKGKLPFQTKVQIFLIAIKVLLVKNDMFYNDLSRILSDMIFFSFLYAKTHPKLNFVLFLFSLHCGVLPLKLFHLFLVDLDTEGQVNNSLGISLKFSWHILLEILQQKKDDKKGRK